MYPSNFADPITGVPKHYGIYKGNITDVLSNNNVKINVEGVKLDADTTAKVMKIAGGTGALSGFNIRPVIGAKCLVMFEQGDVKAPKIIGYIDSDTAGNIGKLDDGDFMFRHEGGSLLQITKDSVELRDVKGYGFAAGAGFLSVRHRDFSLDTSDNAVRMQMLKNATVFYTSGGVITKNADHQESDINYTHSTTGSRNDIVNGNFFLESKNNIKLTGQQVHLQSMQELNFAATRDTAFMTDTFSLTASTDIFAGSTLGNVSIAANAGSVEIGAGTVATATVGITAAAAKITVQQIGTIETFASQKVIETASIGFEGTYGAAGFSVASGGKIDFSSVSKFSVNTAEGMEFLGALNFEVSVGTSFKATAGAGIELTTPGEYEMTSSMSTITSPLITVRTASPIVGLQVITMLGPQPIIPA